MSEAASGKWKVIILRQPEKVLHKLPQDLLKRMRSVMQKLADDPRPAGCKKLAGYDNLYRLRIGGWRVSYAVEDDQLVILVLEIAPRGDAYRLRY